jgi:hypothetical protein
MRRGPACLAALTGLALMAALAATAQTAPRPRPGAGSPPAEAAPPPVDQAVDQPVDPAASAAPDPPADATAGQAVDPGAETDLFAMPRIATETRIALLRLQNGDLEGASAGLDRLIGRHPNMAQLRVTRAVRRLAH